MSNKYYLNLQSNLLNREILLTYKIKYLEHIIDNQMYLNNLLWIIISEKDNIIRQQRSRLVEKKRLKRRTSRTNYHK